MLKKTLAGICGISAFIVFFLIATSFQKIFGNGIIFGYTINLIILIFIFIALSLLKTLISKDRFRNGELATLSIAFWLSHLISNLYHTLPTISLLFNLGLISSAIAIVFFAIVHTFAVVGTRLIIAVPFLNLVQSIIKKDDYDVPLLLQIKVTAGLLISMTIIYYLYKILFYVGPWIFLLAGMLPLIIAGFFLGKPRGKRLDEKEYPELFKIINDTAKKLSISKPSEVLLTPDTGIAVMGVLKKRMMIGIAGLRALTKPQFEAIIAHEFGHFYGNDTVMGYFIGYIKTSMNTVIKGTGALSRISYSYLFYLFMVLYRYIFEAATAIYSRQVEFRADIVAAQIAGSDNFSKGLVEYATYTTYFEQIAYRSIIEGAQNGRYFKNIYEAGSNAYEKEKIGKIRNNVLSQKSHIFSSHPAISDRVANVKIYPALRSKSDVSANSLFKNMTKLEEEMTVYLSAPFWYKMGIIDEKGKLIKKQEGSKK